jgi:hypothetical protein
MWWLGAVNVDASNDTHHIHVNFNHLLYPPELCSAAFDLDNTNDNVTAVTSNVSTRATSYQARALSHILSKTEFMGATFHMKTKGAIADSGATQIFMMEGMPVKNKRKTTHPLRVGLADG